jgi:antitoxin (DNA-binding transcriptional repressor) of toxin-antitoxin stability system
MRHGHFGLWRQRLQECCDVAVRGYNPFMAEPVIHISDIEAARDFASVLAQVRAGAEVIIEHDTQPVAVLRAPLPEARNLSGCLELLPENSTATIDEDFAKDVEAAINSHREPLTPPEWD